MVLVPLRRKSPTLHGYVHRHRHVRPSDVDGPGDPLQRIRVAGHCDAWNGGRPPILVANEQSKRLAVVMAGPDPETDGIRSFMRDDLVAIAKRRFGKSMHPTSMWRLSRKLGLSRQQARLTRPLKSPAAAAAFKKSPVHPRQNSAGT
jgi:transposase